MSREGNLAKNTLILSIGTFLPKLAAFITLPILTGFLTKEDYGTYDLISVLVSLLLPATTLQIQVAAFRFLLEVKHDETEKKKIISNIFAFIIPTSFITLFALYFCLSGIDAPIRITICLYLLADIFVNAARQVCRGLGKNVDYTISAVLSAAGKIVFVVISIYFFKGGLFGAVLSLLGASLFSFLYLLFKVKLYRYVQIKYCNFSKLKEMLHYSWPMVPSSMSSWVMRVSDRIVVTAVMGIPANAVYSVANKIPSLLNIAQNTFTMAWQENASMVANDSDVSEYYSLMFKTIYDFLVGCFCLLTAFTPFLFRLLIRGDYGEAYVHMPILFGAMFFMGLSTYIGGVFIAYKKTKSIGITTVAAAAINLVFDVGTIRYIGLYAASGSTLISYVFLFVFRIVSVQKLVRIQYERWHFFAGIGLIILSSALFLVSMPATNILNLCIGIAAFGCLNKRILFLFWKKGRKALHKRLKL